MHEGLDIIETEESFGSKANNSSNVQDAMSLTSQNESTAQDSEVFPPPLGTQSLDSDDISRRKQATLSKQENYNMTGLGSVDRHFQKRRKWTEVMPGTPNPTGSSTLSLPSEEEKIGQPVFSDNSARYAIFSVPGSSSSSVAVCDKEHRIVSRMLPCFDCEKTFTCVKHFEEHCKIHIRPKQFPGSTAIPSGSGSQSRSSFDMGGISGSRHEATDGVNQSYPISLEAKPSNSVLGTQKKVDSIKKTYACESCEKIFMSRSGLRRHRPKHTGEKPFKCDVCDSAFTQNYILKQHKLIHSGEKPFKCDVCDSAFTQISGLKQHQRIHLGKKPFKCDVCDSAFTLNSHLKRHKRIHKRHNSRAM